jgi:hypothetical protein
MLILSEGGREFMAEVLLKMRESGNPRRQFFMGRFFSWIEVLLIHQFCGGLKGFHSDRDHYLLVPL